tara:strand:+ start:1461 stop:2306 length:846 start_codon:yes stop_codon:yes gene_type:complete
MTTTARMIKDSISPEGIRLPTMVIRNPRIIHSEFMTHRVFSRNASSSRAIPLKTARRSIRQDPAYPASWGANQKGMQAGADLQGWRLGLTKATWDFHRHMSLFCSWLTEKAGAHKQIGNRLTEAHSHIELVVTSTSWANWEALRDHPDADPTIKLTAEAILNCMANSTPKLLQPGEWHLPFVMDYEIRDQGIEEAKIMSVARCARVSYGLHDGSRADYVNDLRLYQQLIGTPVHASPFEHQATPDKKWASKNRWAKPELHGNLHGWVQLRKTIPGEAVHEY